MLLSAAAMKSIISLNRKVLYYVILFLNEINLQTKKKNKKSLNFITFFFIYI
jgi:hypothetical protein